MRFGLVGTGPWAELAHGPGLVAAEGVELVGIWGRSLRSGPAPRRRLRRRGLRRLRGAAGRRRGGGVRGSPAVQAEMALGGGGGRPVTSSSTSPWRPIPARPGPCSPPPRRPVWRRWSSSPTGSSSATRTWIDDVRRTEGWHGGWVRWFSALQEPDNPFGASPWRHEAGALWDTGPHALSTLIATLGPIALAHGGSRPGRRGLPHRTPRVRADQHHRADPVRAARRQPLRGDAVGRGGALDDAAPPGRRLRHPPGRRPRRSWWRAPPAGAARARPALRGPRRRAARGGAGAARPTRRHDGGARMTRCASSSSAARASSAPRAPGARSSRASTSPC